MTVHWTATEWTLLCSAISASIVSIIYTVQKSRCSTVECGCIHCERNVEDHPDIDPTIGAIPPLPPALLSPRLSAITPIGSPSVADRVKRFNTGRVDTTR